MRELGHVPSSKMTKSREGTRKHVFLFGPRYFYILQCPKEGQEAAASSKTLALLLEPVPPTLTFFDFLRVLETQLSVSVDEVRNIQGAVQDM